MSTKQENNPRVMHGGTTQIEGKPYKKDMNYSYVFGAFPTFELIEARPDEVLGVYVHSSFTDVEKLQSLCKQHNIPVWFQDKIIQKLRDKENVFVIGVVRKFEDTLLSERSHIVLVQPSNMGNLGTILRTAIGFGIKDIAIIGDKAVDYFNPKTLRSSMGAAFRIRHASFPDFETYQKQYPNHEVYTFMLTGKKQLTVTDCPKPKLFSLVFGNEATGLPPEYEAYGTSIIIPQTPEVDSLNLTIAVGIGTFLFTRNGEEV